MIKKIGFKLSVNSMLVLLTLVLVYHLLIITGLISYQVVWGGRLETESQMYVFETISIGINSLIILVISAKGKYIKAKISIRIINILLWIITVIFVLNTVGNLFSNNSLETVIFTPLTFISAILCYRIAVEK
ncbi:MAG: hypothetical protein L3J29_12570 [Cyclobacteriaceae bacterium]|nr:hypothetical protein [Cyclobacteriaceae bacterium]